RFCAGLPGLQLADLDVDEDCYEKYKEERYPQPFPSESKVRESSIPGLFTLSRCLQAGLYHLFNLVDGEGVYEDARVGQAIPGLTQFELRAADFHSSSFSFPEDRHCAI